MNQIDNIMALADEYATRRQHAHYKHEIDARQALRTAIEAALSAKNGGGEYSQDTHQPSVDTHQPCNPAEDGVCEALECCQSPRDDTALLKQALEALEELRALHSDDVWLDRWNDAIAALRERLAP